MKRPVFALLTLLAACSGKPPTKAVTPSPSATPSPAPVALIRPDEGHLAKLTQLTFAGENAEAYWTPDDKSLLFQTKRPPFGCDQIMRMPADGSAPAELVSTGKGRTTCAYTYPAGDRVLYSSTHLGGDACRPEPDHSQGYVWALYDSYDIFAARPDGSELTQLTKTPGYDAEATMCRSGKDSGAIVFTSVRDGDLELYRMNADGSDVKRLTRAPGYDGGAFFSADCTQIVWRASRPKPGPELDDFQKLLGQGLVRPTQLELWVANADGSDARQVTYLGAASFGPFFYPNGKRIIFSSNYALGGKPGREFNLWAVNVDGSELERITTSPGFDGFPMFSSDGKRLAFSSNRNQKLEGETNMFVAEWRDQAPPGAALPPSSADRFMTDVRWLADDAREGRGVGTAGLEAAGAHIEQRFRDLGLVPGAAAGSYRAPFEITTGVKVGDATALAVDGKVVARADFQPAGFAASGAAKGSTVFAGYGITAPELKIDDYKRLGNRAKGKIVVVRRFTPEGGDFANDRPRRQYSDLKYKAFNARQHGAIGLIVVDLPEVTPGVPLPAEAALPAPEPSPLGDEGIPVLVLTRAGGAALVKGSHRVELTLALEQIKTTAFNVMARVPARADAATPPDPAASVIVIGAHYDHLGQGGHGSLAPGKVAPHNGADDNASGVAALLEVARTLAAAPAGKDVILIAFAGEELGVLGSTALLRAPVGFDPKHVIAMLNMDMVGRLREGRVQVLGGDSAPEWAELVPPVCAAAGMECALSGGGYGPSDQTPFYAAGIPVLHFFTGSHAQYHTPDDDSALVNGAGGARVAGVVAELARALGAPERHALTYKNAPTPMVLGDSRGGASLGTIPDYAGAPGGKVGVFLAGVRPGGPAELAGIKKGDLLVRMGEVDIRSVEDLMFVLRAAMPGTRVKVTVIRGEQPVDLDVTYGQSVRR